MTQSRQVPPPPNSSAEPKAAEALAGFKTDPSTGLTNAEARKRLAENGPNAVPEQKSHPLLGFARKFWGPSAWMIELIILISAILGKWPDLAVALALLVVNAILSFLQEQRAAAAVATLRTHLQVGARVLRDGSWQRIPANTLVGGDIVRLRSGDFVPADARIIAGVLGVDQSALTGESRQLPKATNDLAYSGSVVGAGEATAVIVATGVGTLYGRTTELVESAHPKLHVEEVVRRVVKWLSAIVAGLVAISIVASLLEGSQFLDILPLSLVLLMGAVPVALPVMFTVSMAVGSMELARQGVLVTRLSAAEDAANMDVVCADKTGTLTLNRLTFLSAAASRFHRRRRFARWCPGVAGSGSGSHRPRLPDGRTGAKVDRWQGRDAVVHAVFREDAPHRGGHRPERDKAPRDQRCPPDSR